MNVENETAVSEGCYRQMKNGHELELCLCETTAGEAPCNSALSHYYELLLTMKIALTVIIFVQFVS